MKNNIKTIIAVSSFVLSGIFTPVMAKELTAEEDFEMALKALPEVADDLANQGANRSSAIRMKCYVDTPAYDQYTYNFCASVGSARTTTAVFAIDNVPAGSTINWSNSNCSSSNSICFVPIRQYRPITVTASVLKPNGTYTTVSATAEYEGWF